tara:strand:+ start:114 stop:500 length:387 start_codon:yes stop_codon:yes gene_type:complete
MNTSKINIRFKRKIQILRDQNIFDTDLQNNCLNAAIPLQVRIGYSISMLDIYSELLEYFISRKENTEAVSEKGYDLLEKKESVHFNRIQYLELYKQKTELQFVRFMRSDMVQLEEEINRPQNDNLLCI